jgi:hypothetical protein
MLEERNKCPCYHRFNLLLFQQGEATPLRPRTSLGRGFSLLGQLLLFFNELIVVGFADAPACAIAKLKAAHLSFAQPTLNRGRVNLQFFCYFVDGEEFH